jgi:hypothetical protein
MQVFGLSLFFQASAVLNVNHFNVHFPDHLAKRFFPVVLGLWVLSGMSQFSGHIAITVITGEVTASS